MAEVEVGAVAPEVPATPAAEAAPQDSAEPAPPEGEKPPAPPEKTFSQKDLDRVAAKIRRDNERLLEERVAARVRAEVAEAKLRDLQPQTAAKGKPLPKDFQSPEEYVGAMVAYELEQRDAARSKETETKRTQTDTQEQGRKLVEAVMKGADEFEDFEEVAMAPNLAIAPPMAHAIAESDIPAKVLYHLGQNPAEALRISKLPSTVQVREIAKLESKLTAPPATTKAPPPITPTSGPASVEKRLEDADYEDFVKIRRKQIAAKNGRM